MLTITADIQNEDEINPIEESVFFPVSNEIPNNLPDIISDASCEKEFHSREENAEFSVSNPIASTDLTETSLDTSNNLQETLNEIDITKLDSLIRTLDSVQVDTFSEEKMTDLSFKETNSQILRKKSSITERQSESMVIYDD